MRVSSTAPTEQTLRGTKPFGEGPGHVTLEDRIGCMKQLLVYPDLKRLFPFFFTTPSPDEITSEEQIAALKTKIIETVTHIFTHLPDDLYEKQNIKDRFDWENLELVLQNFRHLGVLLQLAYDYSLIQGFEKRLGRYMEKNPYGNSVFEKALFVRDWLKRQGNDIDFLDCSNCNMLCFPEELSALPSVERLNLTCNQIMRLPETIDQLTSLCFLYLWDNKLIDLPMALRNITNLYAIAIGFNSFTEFPPVIPYLDSLACLALDEDQHSIFQGHITPLLGMNKNPTGPVERRVETYSPAQVKEICIW